jgi:hypothetical protein
VISYTYEILSSPLGGVQMLILESRSSGHEPVRTADQISQATMQGAAAQSGRSAPLVLTRGQAAGMCGISVHTFDQWVRKNVVPPPIRGTRRWSRVAIERALEGVPSPQPAGIEASPFEQWKRSHAHH